MPSTTRTPSSTLHRLRTAFSSPSSTSTTTSPTSRPTSPAPLHHHHQNRRIRSLSPSGSICSASSSFSTRTPFLSAWHHASSIEDLGSPAELGLLEPRPRMGREMGVVVGIAEVLDGRV